MNERIKELALEAGYLPDSFGIGHWDMPECKKFAELIIQECITSIYKSQNITPGFLINLPSDQLVLQIKKHFGVD
jgi:hypothetical protein